MFTFVCLYECQLGTIIIRIGVDLLLCEIDQVLGNQTFFIEL